MKCADIPDAVFLAAVLSTPGVGGSTEPDAWRMRWDVRAVLEHAVGSIPEKLFLAKAHKLIRRGLMHGCDCGCRGDYHLPDGCNGRC